MLPSAEAVVGGTYVPLSRPLFIYVSEKAYARPEVKQFVDFTFANVAKLAAEVQYVPLPADAYTTIAKHVADGKLGTVFNGEAATSVTIEDLLKREVSL